MDPEELKALIASQVTEAVSAASGSLVELVAAKLAESAVAVAEPEPASEPPPPPTADERLARLEEADRRRGAELRIDRRLATVTGLSEVGKAKVRKSVLKEAYRGELTDEALEAEIQEAIDYEARFAAAAPKSIVPATVGDSEADRVHKALQGWFGGAPVDGIKPIRDLREGYALWTGQQYLDIDADEMWRAFATQYVGHTDSKRIKESLTTASWGQIFADVQNMMMIRAFNDDQRYQSDWPLFVSEFESVEDFQTRHWPRIGGYSNLGTVAEQATYPTTTSPADEEVTYAITKRGYLDDWTMEMASSARGNSKIRQLPRLMGRAASRTLYAFVMDMLTTGNPTLDYDSVALYDAAHANTGTTALSVSGLNTTQIAMRDQTAYGESSEILGPRNAIRYLIVPNELENRARRVTGDFGPNANYNYALSSTPDADTALDPNTFHARGIRVVVYDALTDATDWWAFADPAEVPLLVMGFFRGQRAPELFMADNPLVGSAFTADKYVLKIRHIYGGDVLDHRGAYRQVVGG